LLARLTPMAPAATASGSTDGSTAASTSRPTQAPNGPAGSLIARGGGPGYTGTYAQYPPHYKPHTTINGSRASFVVVTVIAGLVFFTLIGLGWWYMRFRRRKRLISRGASGSASSKRTSTGRPSGLFGRNTNSSSRPWGRLRDNDNDNDAEDDAFAMAPSANVSVMDLNGQDLSHKLDTHELAKRWNPAYAASGESLNWQDDKDAGAGNARRPAEDTKEAEYVRVERQ